MSDHPNDSVAVCLPTEMGSNGDGRKRLVIPNQIKNAWLAATFPLREIWSPLAHDVRDTVKRIGNWNHDVNPNQQQVMRSLIELVSHLILCMIMTILLPISLPWKQIKRGRFTLTCKWLLAVSCIAMTCDPLFLYIPFIDEKNKCLGMNKKLRAAALALRSLTDLAFAFHIVALIHDRISAPPDPDLSPKDHVAECTSMRRKWLCKDIIIDSIGILPIPQVLGASWYFLSIQREMSCWHQTYKNITGCVATNYCEDTSSSTCKNITLLNEFCPIDPSNATLHDFGIFLGALESGNVGPKSFWTKYFYAFWWGIRNLSNFGTDLETSNFPWENCFTIIICLVGLLLFIYLMGNVQTYILWESTRVLKDQVKTVESKYRDLNCWLSIHGIREETKTEVVKIIKQNNVVERHYGDGRDVPVDLVFVFNTIKVNNAKKWEFLAHFCENALKKVTILQHRSILDLGDLLDALHPVSYAKDSYVVQQGKLDDKMLIITEGIITCTYKTTPSMIPKSRFEKGEVYGQELLSMDWNHLIDLTPDPESIPDVKCETKVEAFAVTVDKLKSIARFLDDAYDSALQYRSHDPEEANKAYGELTTTKSKKMDRIEKDIIEWLSRNGVPYNLQTSVKNHIKANHHLLEKDLDAQVDLKYLFSIGLSGDIEYHIKEHLCMSTLYKVPVLKSVDEDVLHRICMSLEPVILAKNNDVFKPGDQIDRMLIIVEGEIISTERTIFRGYGPTEKPNVERIYEGKFLGEKVLMSAFPDTSISNSRPAISNEYVQCCTKVEAFALTKEGVKKVVTYYREGTNKSEQVENGRDGVANTKGASTSTTTIEQRLDHLMQLQSDMFQQQGRRLDEMAAFLLMRYGSTA